jgi:hypothetical protein
MRSLVERYRFFREYAGGWVGHSAEVALRLARAEMRAESLDLGVYYEDDDLEWDGEGPAPKHLLWIAVYRKGDVDRKNYRMHINAVPLASLGSVGVDDLRDPYLRVVAAELYVEALDALDKENDRIATEQAEELSGRPTYAAGGVL